MEEARVWAQELFWREPDTVFAAWGEAPWCVFLDSGGPVEERSRWQIFCRMPRNTFIVRDKQIFRDSEPPEPCDAGILFALLRHVMPPAGQVPESLDGVSLPFYGGLIGFAGYGLGMQLEGIQSLSSKGDEPDFSAGFYDHAFLWDRFSKRAFVAGIVLEGQGDAATAQREACVAAWHALPDTLPAQLALPKVHFHPDQSRASYCQAVERAKAYIGAGDIFQVNITGRYRAQFPEEFSNVALFLALRRQAPAPFGAYLSCGAGYALHSASPEQFLRMDAQGRVVSRPIKGTAPRGSTPEDDADLSARLRADEKECAENLMIVDLMRNDIGRVAQVGSMQVPEFLKVERFAHVHHLVSEVRGVLEAGRDVWSLLQATLPPGSVTGAPKHRAMEIIEELEASPRGAYCGSIFCVGVDGALQSSVIIRALIRKEGSLVLAAGGGITILSDAEREYEEMRLKLAPFFALFGDAR